MNSTRNHILDLLKGIAVLLMIQVHVMELFASDLISTNTIGKLSLFLGGAPVAPLFMVVFGHFISKTYQSTMQLIVRGIKMFALGMILNVALNLNLISSVCFGKLDVDLMPYIFGVDILHFAGIALIIIAPFKKWFQKQYLLPLITMLVAALLGHYLLNYVPNNNVLKYVSAFFYGSMPWSYFPVFPWLAYPLAGMVVYQLQQRYDFSWLLVVKTKIVLSVLFLIFIVFTVKYAIIISSDLPLYYHHGLLFFGWVMTFLFFYTFGINELNERFGETSVFKYIKWLGKNVTLIYVIQWILIGNIATAIYKTVVNPLYISLSVLGIIAVSSGIAYLVLRLKGRLSMKVDA
jgi:uncharacterized membrane protein